MYFQIQTLHGVRRQVQYLVLSVSCSTTRCRHYRYSQRMAEVSSPPTLTVLEPTREEVITRLQEADAREMLARLPPLPASVKRAAVLLPLFYRNGKLHILLTVRSWNLRTHRGEVAFPGGKCDESDADFKETALRESEEEVGLTRDNVEVVAQLGPAFARGGTLVIPIAGFIPEDFSPVPNPFEVQDVFSVPLSYFLREQDHFLKIFTGDSGQEYRLHVFLYNKGDKTFQIFGFTASLCILAASICFAQAAEFETDFEFDSTYPKKILESSYNSYMRHVKQVEETMERGKL